jgi:hypothetical protein
MVQETISIVIEGKDNASDDIKRVQSNMQQMNQTTQTSETRMQRASSGMRSFAMAAGGATVAVGAAAAVVVKVGSEYQQLGQRLTSTTAIFEAMAGGVEEADSLLNRLQRTTKNVVSDVDLMTGANQLMRMGIANNADEVNRFIDLAVKLKQPTESASEAIDNMALMIANQSYERLDSFGISSAKVRQEMKLLREAGMSVEEAFSTAFLKGGEDAVLALGDSVETATTRVMELQTAMANFQGEMGVTTNYFAESLAGAMLLMGFDERNSAEYRELYDDVRENTRAFFERWGVQFENPPPLPTQDYAPVDQALIDAQRAIFGYSGGSTMASDYGFVPTPATVPSTTFTLDQQLQTVNDRLRLSSQEYINYLKAIATAPNTFLNQMARGDYLQSSTISIQNFINHFEELEEAIIDDRDILESFGESARSAYDALNFGRIKTDDWYTILEIFERANVELQKIAKIKLQPLDELLNREPPATNQQTGLVQMMLGFVDDGDLRSQIQREMDLLTGVESSLGDYVETEVAEYIAGIAETLGSDVAFGVIESVQNALQRGEYLALDDEEIISMIKQATLQATPRAQLMQPSGGGYTVQPGDTPWGILASMGIPTAQLPAMSQQMLQMYGMLQPGMQVGIPGMTGGGFLPSDAILVSNQLNQQPGAPVDKIVSDQAREEIDALKTDFDEINEKIRIIQGRVNQTFSDVSMTATVYIRARFDPADKKYIDYVLAGGRGENLFNDRQEIPGGSPPPEQTIG